MADEEKDETSLAERVRGIFNEAIADQIRITLNELAAIDPVAIFNLIEQRIPCTKELGEHPRVTTTQEGEQDLVGLLGILNALLVDVDKKRIMVDMVQVENEPPKLTFSIATPESHPMFFGPAMMTQHMYILGKDGNVAIEKTLVPVPVGDPLYEATKAHSEAAGMPACGVQVFKKGEEPGEIQTISIPPAKGETSTQ